MTSVSVIVPTFNRPVETVRAVSSVLSQDADGIEVIVVDDGSAIPLPCESGILADPRVRVVRRDTNGGAAAARNTGMAAAAGHWLSFLDSDDWLLAGTLPARVRMAEQHRAANPDRLTAFVCGFLDVAPDGTVVRARIPFGASRLDEFASGCWFSPGSCLLMRRQDAVAIGPQDEALRRLEDLDWFLRFGCAGGHLVAQDLIGTALTVGHHTTLAAVLAATRRLEAIWLAGSAGARLSGPARRRLTAYLDLVRGVTALHERQWGAACRFLAGSLARWPRLRSQLCPGWRIMDRWPFGDPAALRAVSAETAS